MDVVATGAFSPVVGGANNDLCSATTVLAKFFNEVTKLTSAPSLWLRAEFKLRWLTVAVVAAACFSVEVGAVVF